MRITTKGRYSVRALCEVARHDGKPISIKKLAQIEGISAEFLEQLFFMLKKQGILRSQKGPGGGFALARGAAEITIHEIFVAVEENYNIAPCASLYEADMKRCPRSAEDRMGCWTEDFWCHTLDLAQHYFSNVTLSDVINKTGYREKFPVNFLKNQD